MSIPSNTIAETGHRLKPPSAAQQPVVPAYLRNTYSWAYLDPLNVALLDRNAVISAILFGNRERLRKAVLEELSPGQHVLQASHIYGDFVTVLARFLGSGGRLEVIDVAPVQVARCRKKLAGLPQATVRRADAAAPGGGPYDAVSCFFLLHEVPDAYKRAIVDALLVVVRPGGRVVFIDYQEPPWTNPLKGLMSLVFYWLEPYARGLWGRDVSDFATSPGDFSWTSRTYFGGLYRKTVARRHTG